VPPRTLSLFAVRRRAVRAEPPIASLPIDAPRWSTSSFSPDTPTSPQELSLLGEHLDHCKRPHGGWFTLQCVAETLDRFLSARLVTTLVAAALLMGLAFSLL
jgi:hypothetical protein